MTRLTDGPAVLASAQRGAHGTAMHRSADRWAVAGGIAAALALSALRPAPSMAQAARPASEGAAPTESGSVLELSFVAQGTVYHKLTLPSGTSQLVELDGPVVRVTKVAESKEQSPTDAGATSGGPPGPGAGVQITELAAGAGSKDSQSVAEVTILSPRQILVTALAIGSVQFVLWNDQGGQIVLDVWVKINLSLLEEAIARISPGAAIEVSAMKDAVILSGKVADVDASKRIMDVASVVAPRVFNHMTVAGAQQVLLRCRVAEVSKLAARRLGVNGWLAGDNVRDVFVVSQIAGINPVNIGGAPTGNIIQPGGLSFGTDPNGLPLLPSTDLSLGFPRAQMQVFLQALRENRLLRILAEPNLVALSGQEATFLAGGEFPVPVPQSLGTTTIEWREFGVRLRFTPTVIGRQMIRLRVAPEVSERDFSTAVTLAGGTTVPGLLSRSAETTIEMASGSTIAIAGLLSERVQATSLKVPGLGDVPILGALFSSVEYQKNQTELVILVTPDLIDSMQPDQVAPVPGQFMTDPNDWQLFGLGMLEGEPATGAADDAEGGETRLPPKYRRYASPPEQMSLHGPWGPADVSETVQ